MWVENFSTCVYTVAFIRGGLGKGKTNSRYVLTAAHCDRTKLDVKTLDVLTYTQISPLVGRSHTFNPLQNAPQAR
ncbi:MAG TPA: hypothetical protein VE944_05735 [Nostoc sp.]|uniref:hypothetical protein n=1 Tax=Nostoc sp. TaxID=1180 RepID=UPI002D45550B|nr:hypothetical protein [Nostoc sp.]HYX13865.1 hypothetical protein [Nostoc sp.]